MAIQTKTRATHFNSAHKAPKGQWHSGFGTSTSQIIPCPMARAGQHGGFLATGAASYKTKFTLPFPKLARGA